MARSPPEEQRAKVAEIELATAGTKGHEKSRRQRQVLGEAKPRIKSRKEITKALEDASGEYAEALLWFAALVSVVGWVAVVAVILGVCMMIEWVTA